MGRANPIAAIYMLTNNINGKVYIGETYNIAGRMSHYRNTYKRDPKYVNRPIEKAIVEYGFDNFSLELLATQESDPELTNTQYRADLEKHYIMKYNALNSRYGYNDILDEYDHMPNIPHKSVPHTQKTKCKKSDMVMVYETDTKSTYLYLGKKSFGDSISKSRAQVSHAARDGKKMHGVYVFNIKKEVRAAAIENRITRVVNHRNHKQLVRESLIPYLQAAREVNEFCKMIGFPVVDIDKYNDIINSAL